MSKKLLTIILIFVILAGSIFSFYATNMLFSDISNLYAGFVDAGIISTFPMFMLLTESVLTVIYLCRLIKRPQYKKALTKKYLYISFGFLSVGLICSILSGTVVYHSFLKPYPFPCYSLVMTIAYVLLLSTAIYAYFLVNKRMPEDEEKREFAIEYTMYTGLNSVMIWIALNRFGAFLYFPFYVQWRLFGLLLPFILLLPLLLSMMIQSFLYAYKSYSAHAKGAYMYAIINLSLGIILNIIHFVLYFTNSTYVAMVSFPMGLERISTSNLTSIVLLIMVVILGIVNVVKAYGIYMKSKRVSSETKE